LIVFVDNSLEATIYYVHSNSYERSPNHSQAQYKIQIVQLKKEKEEEAQTNQ